MFRIQLTMSVRSVDRRGTETMRGELLVMKFGGSSLADHECLKRVRDIVVASFARKPVVVVSAMGRTTNALLKAAQRAEVDSIVDITDIEAQLEELEAEAELESRRPSRC